MKFHHILALAICGLVGLFGCAPFKTVPHEGPVETGQRPQMEAQCRDQPNLDWCPHAH